MSKIAIGFFKGLLGLPGPWRLWVGLLMLVNGVAPLLFLPAIESWAVLLAMLLGAVLQMAIFGARGFVRLLGAGHLVVWVPLLIWLALRLPAIEPGVFRTWVLAVIVIDAISLIIDLVDVIRYARGDRAPSLTLEDLDPGRSLAD